jgi:hypothetical protein
MILGISMQLGQGIQLDPVTQGTLLGFFLGVIFGVTIIIVVALLATRKKDQMIRKGKYIEVDGTKKKEEEDNENHPIV